MVKGKDKDKDKGKRMQVVRKLLRGVNRTRCIMRVARIRLARSRILIR